MSSASSRRFSDMRLVVLARLQTLRELHAEAAGRNEALVALEALTGESGARQERLREAMQACQHLQSELEAAQVAPLLPRMHTPQCTPLLRASGKLLPAGKGPVPVCGSKGTRLSAGR